MSRIERADLEAKLREIEEAVDETKEAARNATTAIVIGVVVVILAAYLLGRRKGRKARSARIEVYRL